MSRVYPSWLSFVLYNPVRKKFTDRLNILRESGITGESVVLEVGAGNGFLTEIIAGSARKVVVIELQDGMVKKLRKRISTFGDKVDIVTADIASCKLETGFADVCLLYYCFHEVANKSDAVRNISFAVKKGGHLSIYEPKMEVKRQDMIATIRMFTDAGFVLENERVNMFSRFARLKKVG